MAKGKVKRSNPKRKFKTKEVSDALAEFGLLDVPSPPEKQKKRIDRRRIKVDETEEQKVYNIAKFGGTVGEIAIILSIDETTVRNKYSSVISKGHSDMALSLKRKGYMVAMQGNPTMLKWMGINYADQTDKKTITLDTQNSFQNLSDDQIKAKTAALVNELGLTPNKHTEIKNDIPSTDVGTTDAPLA